MPCNRLNIEFKPPRNTPRLRRDNNPREWAALHQNIGDRLHRRCVSDQSLIDLEARAIEPPARLTRSAPCRRDALAFSPCERAPCRLRWDEEGERRFPIVQSYLAQLLEERPGVRPFVRQDEILSAPLVAGLCRLDLHVAAPFRSRCLSKEQTIVGTLAGYWRRINVHQPECEADSASRSGKDPIRFEACCWNSAELASGLHERALARQGAVRAGMGSAR